MTRYEYPKSGLTDMRRIEYASRAFIATHAAIGKTTPNPARYAEVVVVEPPHNRRGIPARARRRLDARHEEEQRAEQVVEDKHHPPREPQLALGVVPQVPGDAVQGPGGGAAAAPAASSPRSCLTILPRSSARSR